MSHNRAVSGTQDHNKMVSHVANWFHRNGYQTKADHISWPAGSPDQIGRHVPDVTASNAKGSFIVEVETSSSYSDQHTKDQLTDFSRKNGWVTFIVVPTICSVSDVRAKLQEWGLLGKVQVATCNISSGEINWEPK